MQHSIVAETVDAIHVAVGLRLMGVVLFGAYTRPEPPSDVPIELLIVLDEDLPEGEAERQQYLTRLMPVGTLDHAQVTIRTLGEFAQDPADRYRDLAREGKILLNLSPVIPRRLAEIRAEEK
jgi:hypothetical protein